MDNSQKNINQGGVPTFTPPTPTFTPPAPTFAPPANSVRAHNGPSCYYHQSEPAVARCSRCGKCLCQDCFESYGVTNDEFQGKALCFDCTQKLVADNVAQLTANKEKIKGQFILSLIGIGIGFILGIIQGIEARDFTTAIVGALIYGGIGGMFLSFVKTYLWLCWELIKAMFTSIFDGSGVYGLIGAVIGAVFRIFIEAIKCLFYTISNTIHYIVYLKRTSGFIESDQAALQQMQDYMEYTLIRNQNRGVDIETLLKENSELADNSIAQMARTQSEEQIEATMRSCVASINENGEIIRSFHENGIPAPAAAA